MRGYKDFNFPAFFQAAKLLRDKGHFVFSPAERDTSKFGSEKLKSDSGDAEEFAKNVGMKNAKEALRDCMLADTTFICSEADAVYLLPGWGASKGALAERALALAIGLEVVEL